MKGKDKSSLFLRVFSFNEPRQYLERERESARTRVCVCVGGLGKEGKNILIAMYSCEGRVRGRKKFVHFSKPSRCRSDFLIWAESLGFIFFVSFTPIKTGLSYVIYRFSIFIILSIHAKQKIRYSSGLGCTYAIRRAVAIRCDQL